MARKILLADDSVTAQNMGRKILADAGYEVVTVNNGSAALKKIAELRPDLVILDVYMPGYSGLEVCQRLKESQDSSRIPVLLSVGKLEPFKPEEAQRVRADSYIVKPFEASELLSALSKLEDKVVPRSEPSKSGRFARTLAAVEENTRGGRSEKSSGEKLSEESGWKSRIGFPAEKKDSEQPIAQQDDSSIYNPVNRDLRTVVETPAERAAEKHDQHPPGAEPIVDVAALVPPGFPSDVTAEEVAAIAAASAQIQMAADAAKELDEADASAAGFAASAQPDVPSESPVNLGMQAEVNSDAQSPALAAVLSHTNIADVANDTTIEEGHDLPMTMAAAAGAGSSRWVAVGVALEGDEANISLEHEMQKVYAAFTPEEVRTPAPVESQESVAAPSSSTTEVVDHTSVAVVVADPTEPPIHAEATEPLPSENAASAGGMQVPEPSAEVPYIEPLPIEPIPIETPRTELAEQPAESVTQTVAVPRLAESVAAEPVAVADPNTPETENPPESETVKTAAAAWASWRQIRDANETKNETKLATPESTGQDFEMSAPQTAEPAAMAVAAGAEQAPLETIVSSLEGAALEGAASSNHAADVASIVDSVLADLRPKLMAEISRKMAEKK